jgi:hypothetical protein
MITVLTVFEAYSKPTLFRKAAVNQNEQYSVWIVPCGTDGNEDIDSLLAHSGIQVLERVNLKNAEKCAEDIQRKFKIAGLDTKRELLSND